MTHDQLQAQAYQWAHNTFPEIRGQIYAILNEVHPHPGESTKAFMIRVNKCKAIGLRKGILDLQLVVPGAVYEFDAKIKPDKLSEKQLERVQLLRKLGGDGFAFYSLSEFQGIFTELIIKHYGQTH